jgi:CRP/FNR family transcriptional regulator, cyclic AMP receptor protein
MARQQQGKEDFMAPSTMTARTSLASIHPSPDLLKKANTPYGLPIIEDCISCGARNSGFFCEISQASLTALDEIKYTTSYPKGALLFVEGQTPRGVYILCEGQAKLLTTNRDGRTLMLKIAQPGDVFGLNSVMTGKPYELTVEILQPSQLVFIGREDFLRFLEKHADARMQTALHLSQDCHSAYDVIRSIGLCHSVPERLARLLLDQSAGGRLSEGVVRAKLALTHEEMAQLIGSSRESVTRTLTEFKKRGTAELHGSTLLIWDKAALESLAAQ